MTRAHCQTKTHIWTNDDGRAIAHVTDPEGADGLHNQAMGDLSSEELGQFNQAIDARVIELNQKLDMALAEE